MYAENTESLDVYFLQFFSEKQTMMYTFDFTSNKAAQLRGDEK